MTPSARLIWSALEFRKPMMLRNIEPLSEEQMRWRPGEGRNSIAWQLWHIAEVEENWISALVKDRPARLPFAVALREAGDDQYPPKHALLEYFQAVREISRSRLKALTEQSLDRVVGDPDFGDLAIRDLWAGVVTSFAWHAGQIALTAKLLPATPVTTMQFNYKWKADAGQA